MGSFKPFDMEKYFNKESLLDVIYTLIKEAKICVRTSVGESGTCRVKNSLGQGMLGAALASSLNIGCALK